MVRTSILNAALAVAALLACSACGGGGGGESNPAPPPPPPPPSVVRSQIALGDATIAAGSTRAELPLVWTAGTVNAVAVQVDVVVVDPTIVEHSTTELSETRALERVESSVLSTVRRRIILGDLATPTAPPELPTGELLRVPVATTAGGRVAGTVEIRLERAVATDADGARVALDVGSPATVTVR